MHAHSSHCCCVPAQGKQALQVNAACYVCVRSQVLAAGVKGNSMHRSHHPEHAPSRPIRMGLTSTRLSDRPGTSSADVLCFGEQASCCWSAVGVGKPYQTGCLPCFAAVSNLLLLSLSLMLVLGVSRRVSQQQPFPAQTTLQACLPAPSELADLLLPRCMHTAHIAAVCQHKASKLCR